MPIATACKQPVPSMRQCTSACDCTAIFYDIKAQMTFTLYQDFTSPGSIIALIPHRCKYGIYLRPDTSGFLRINNTFYSDQISAHAELSLIHI